MKQKNIKVNLLGNLLSGKRAICVGEGAAAMNQGWGMIRAGQVF